MAHTPGPWFVFGNESYRDIRDEENHHTVAEIRPRWNRDEESPNAHLIAAAPDLLAACEYALEELENMTTDQFSKGADRQARNALAAAIAKARGEVDD